MYSKKIEWEMRILYITHLTGRNGATTALFNIIKGMTAKNISVALVVPSRTGYLYEKVKSLNVTIYDGHGYPFALWQSTERNKCKHLKWLFWQTTAILRAHYFILTAINDFHPDVVHCNTSVIDYGLLGCWLKHIPFVWHAREYIDKDFGHKIFPSMAFLRWKMRLPFCHCIAITKGVFEHFELNISKDTIIYDGVVSDKVIPFPKIKKIPFLFFLYTGTFIEGKGVHTIFEQFGKFHQQHPEICLCLACSYDKNSNYYKKCMQIAERENFIDSVHFLGFRTDVLTLMSEAVAQIVPSRFEGFGLITAEAMSVGALVIGKNTAGTKEQFDNGLKQTGAEIGLRYEKDEELPLMMNIALTKNLSEMKQRAYNVVRMNYSIKTQNDKLYHFYQNILGTNKNNF